LVSVLVSEQAEAEADLAVIVEQKQIH